MKRILLLMLVLCMLPLAYAQGLSTQGTAVTASAESISPHPVEPGQDFTLQLRVYNDGGSLADGVTIQYTENTVFTMTGKDDTFDSSFSLCSRCTRDNLYYFTVSADANSGDYPLIFKVTDSGVTRQETIMISVTGKPDIIFDAELIEESISADSLFTAKLTIRNVGSGSAKKIKIVPQTEGFVMENANLIFIDELKPGESIVKEVSFMVSGDAKAGPQKLVLDIDYTDEQSAEYSIEQSLGVKLLNKVQLNIAAVTIDPQPIQKDNKAVVTVRVENLGEGKAENIQVSLTNSGFEGQSKAYIGKLDEGEDAPAVFTLFPTSTGAHHFRVTVSYEDDTGANELIEELELLVVGQSFTRYVLIVIALAGFVYFIYAYFLKHKE